MSAFSLFELKCLVSKNYFGKLILVQGLVLV